MFCSKGSRGLGAESSRASESMHRLTRCYLSLFMECVNSKSNNNKKAPRGSLEGK